MNLARSIITIIVLMAATMVTRFLPFLIFKPGDDMPKFIKYLGKFNQSGGKLILPICGLCAFAAHSGVACTGSAACGLFTLKTKHLVHTKSSLFGYIIARVLQNIKPSVSFMRLF